nr:VAMP-like protein YKT61 [Ipomoea batatas]
MYVALGRVKHRLRFSALGFMDDPYPVRSAFSLLNQDPAEADKLLKIQRELDETKIILNGLDTKVEKHDSSVQKQIKDN